MVVPEEDPALTRLLRAAGRGDPHAAEELLPLVYDELRRLARILLARLPPGQTLQATELVHEAWLRVFRAGDPGWDCREHFFATAAQAIRRILVDQARRRASLKRDVSRRSDRDPAELSPADLAIEVQPRFQDLLAVDEALQRHEARRPRVGQVVNLRFFAGLTMSQVAESLQISKATAEREWSYARAWLQDQVGT